jgi:hypothetical protein
MVRERDKDIEIYSGGPEVRYSTGGIYLEKKLAVYKNLCNLYPILHL